jgi:hypothetical protein
MTISRKDISKMYKAYLDAVYDGNWTWGYVVASTDQLDLYGRIRQATQLREFFKVRVLKLPSADTNFDDMCEHIYNQLDKAYTEQMEEETGSMW